MPQETILVVDDDPHILELSRLYLETEGFLVITAATGCDALRRVESEDPDLVVLDLMLPELDGWQVCRQLRAQSQLPIIMVTARSDDVDKIVGLELGADDYMTKPFNPRELAARVKAVLRRSQAPPAPDTVLRAGPLVVDRSRREARLDDRPIALRGQEFDLLAVLVEHRNMALSRELLLEKAWGFEYYGETRTVDVHVAQLRRCLGDGPVAIETVWGVGYKLVVN